MDEPWLTRDAALADSGFVYMWEASVGDDIASGHLVSALDGWMPSSREF